MTYSNHKVDVEIPRMLCWAQIFAQLGMLLLILEASNVLANSHSTKPHVHDTGYEIITAAPTPSLYWLDNHRLLFAGMKAGRGPRPDLRKLYIWDASTRSTNLYADAKGVCVADGIVRYTVRVDREAGKAVVREGPFGSEREVDEPLPPVDGAAREPAVHSNFTCRTHFRSKLVPPAQRFRQLVVLRNGDGYLDLQPGGGTDLIAQLNAPRRNLVLYQANGKAIELPMTWDENFSPSDVAYSTYQHAYVLRPRAPKGSPIGISGSWPKGEPLAIYLLSATGRVETFSVPYSVSDFLASPRPTVAGWIFGGGRTPQTAGLYMFDGRAASKLDVGSVKEATVTSDGCRAAIAIQNEPFEMGTPTNLKLFEFCARRQ